MAIDPLARGLPSTAHVSLREGGRLARGGRAFPAIDVQPGPPPFRTTAERFRLAAAAPKIEAGEGALQVGPHTPVATAGTLGGADAWDGMLQRLGNKHNVPWLFFKAVMLSESGGRPDAVGDDGHSVGLFQLHDRGYGYGMGDSRFDPETNAARGVEGLAASWHKVTGAGFTGEERLRAAYDDTFNPGGGWAYQGDAVVRYYDALTG